VAQKSASKEKMRRVVFMGSPEKWWQVAQVCMVIKRVRLIGLDIIN
jgi:hypothetical protein